MVNITKELQAKEYRTLTLEDATIEELIIAGMQDLETDIPLRLLPQRGIDRKKLALYRTVLITLVKKTNQDFYTRFTLEKGIDFIPVYLSFDERTLSVRLHIRRDFLKEKLQVDMGFPSWLRSKKSIGLNIPHRVRKSRQAEKYLSAMDSDPNGRGTEKLKPKWWNKWYNEYLKEYGDNKYNPASASRVNRSTKIHGTGLPISRIGYGYRQSFKVKKGEIHKFSQQFTKPIQWNSLKKALDPETFNDLFGDNNQKAYLKKYQVNTKMYNKCISEVLTQYNKVLMHIEMNSLTDEMVNKYEGTFKPRFPNISRIRRWYVNKGIYNQDKKGNGKHQYTLQNFAKLKSNTARANFIDRATFVIANSIFMKSNNISPTFSSGKFKKTAGARTSINRARDYKKFSKTRNKYQSKRTRKYEDWSLDNRKIAANLKRTNTRKDNRSRRQT
jgi:hypothetical protein